MTLLTASDLHKQFGSRTVLDGATFTLDEGEHIGIVGVNGSGKTTLLRILAGLDYAELGTVALKRGARVGLLTQEPDLDPNHTIQEEMQSALTEHTRAIRAWEETTQHLEHLQEGADVDALMAALEDLQHRVEHLGGFDLSHEIHAVLDALGLPDPSRSIARLSGGEKKRVAIGKVLIQKPDLLILDEPTNHLDADTVLWLEERLATFTGGILLVTHDRYFLDNVVHRIIEVSNGRVKSYPGRYEEYVEAKAEEMAAAEKAESTRQNLMRTELEWLRRGPKARTTKSRSRIDRAEALLEQKGPPKNELARMSFGDSLRLGKTILHLDHIHKSFGSQPLIRDLTLDMNKGEKIGIIGPNGSGKTTLLKLITGELSPDRGEVIRGQNTSILYFDQTRELLNPESTVREEVADQGDYVDMPGGRMHIVSYLEQFLFPSDTHRMPIKALSGGERNRILLAKLMKRQANLLILDEPTNDLDLLTLQVLEDAIGRFSGCVITVTHDRYFLNKVATSILSFEGKGKVIKYVGNYDTYRSLKSQAEKAEFDLKADMGQKPTRVQERASTPSPERKRSQKLSWAEERELEGLPAAIEHAEKEQAEIEAKLADPNVFSQSSRVIELTSRLSLLGQELEQKYARWEALEGRKTS